MDLLHFIKLLLRHSKILVLTPVLTAVSIYFLTENQPRTYISSALLYTGLAAGKQGNMGTTQRKDYFLVQATFDNMMHLIKSDQILHQAVINIIDTLQQDSTSEEFLLLQTYLSEQEYTITIDSLKKELLEKKYSKAQTSFMQDENNLFGKKGVRSNLTTKREGSSDLLRLSYIGRTARLAQLTLSEVVSVFLQEYKALKNSEVNSAVAFFKNQTELAQKGLNQAENSLKRFREESKIINYYEQTKYLADQLITLELEKNRVLMDRNGAYAEIKKLQKSLGNGDLLAELQKMLSSETALVQKKSDLHKLEREALLDRIYKRVPSSEKSLLEEAQKELQNKAYSYWKERFVTLEGNRAGLIGQWFTASLTYESAKAKATTIDTEIKRLKPLVYDFAPLGSQLNKLEREAKILEEEYLEMHHNLNVAILNQKDLELTSVISIVDTPSLPARPQGSKRVMTLIMGFMTSLFLSIGTVLAFHYLDRSIRTPSRLKEELNLDTILTLPEMRQLPRYLYDRVLERSMEQFEFFIAEKVEGKKNLSILVIGWSSKSGKSFTTDLITEQLKTILPTIQKELFTIGSAIEKEGIQVYDTPSIIEHPLLLKEVAKADIILPLFSAQEVISPAMIRMVEQLKKEGNLAGAVLTRASEEGLEEALGELPKKRSALRRLIKRFLRGEHID